jgi:alkyldihydroxyacetonephosphate synthase
MAMKSKPRKSIWMFGLEKDEPTDRERSDHAKQLSKDLGMEITLPPIPKTGELELRNPRIKPPTALEEICLTDNYERALHSKGDRLEEFTGVFRNPPDIVAHPRTEDELEAVLEWCSNKGHAAIPFGGGSSSVDGVQPPDGYDGIVTIDMDQFDQVLEIDPVSRAARIQAGIYGPELEDRLRPEGFTLRHFPQSFALSTLGGWIATRSGGHYATNDTHIDDFVESTRMLTPVGWWESRRVPASGAGPSPDRLTIGSEGILGIITESWMRIQVRPRFRATASIIFDTWQQGYEATRQIVQTKLWPANLRLLDPALSATSAGLNGQQAALILGFESADTPQNWPMETAVAIARSLGGHIDDDEIIFAEKGKPTGRQGAAGAWRNAFIPSGKNVGMGMGWVANTVESAITWDKWPEFDEQVRSATLSILKEVCGGGTVNCRFTHVYIDGPAPYYTFAGNYRPGITLADQMAVKSAISDAVMKAGGTITHHHAVGRQHRPWYDEQRPEPFTLALRAAKKAVDPNGVLNPGVLIDP